LARVRPYFLADEWRVDRRGLLDLFLWATHFGVFDLQWDFLCPLCGGARQRARELSSLGDRIHCDTCNLDLESNIESAIELTFRVNPAIRDALGAEFCVAGPEVTPHVVAQQLLAPAEKRDLAIALEPGRYRLRTLGQLGGEFITIASTGKAEAAVMIDESGWPSAELALSPYPTLNLDNESGAERLLVLERFDWADQAVTAAQVIAMQTFRDLFSRELLRPGQEINIASLTIAFTDLRDSTRIYRQIGDASAFSRVLDHFAILQEEIKAEGGTVVKTIGDAVMAVFPRPLAGIKAMTRSQTRLAEAMAEEDTRFYLKAGMHEGACIAVTLNDRLDYFGNVVNLASRLERFSTGADVIISEAVRIDPEVDAYLAAGHYGMEEFEAQLKGFDENEFRLWRVGPIATA
jgi:class 3 adenylate cyclase